MQLFTVKTLSKDIYTAQMPPSQTVGQLKRELSKQSKLDHSMIKLIYSGTVLSDEAELGSLKYTDKDFIVMMKSRPAQPKTPVSSIPPSTNANTNSQTPAKNTDLFNTHNTNPNKIIVNSNNRNLLNETHINTLNTALSDDELLQFFFEQEPELREQLQNPEILIEFLRRYNNPLVDDMPDLLRINYPNTDLEELAQLATSHTPLKRTDSSEREDSTDSNDSIGTIPISAQEAYDINLIKQQVGVMLFELGLDDAQINGLIYQSYMASNCQADDASQLIINSVIHRFQ